MEEVRKKKKWLERYMPFIARSPEMQVEWLAQALRRQVLASNEITPYIRLLLESEDSGIRSRIRASLQELDYWMIERLVEAADIYDTPKLFSILPDCTVEQVMTALGKEAPPYEQHPRLVRDRLFYAVYSRAPHLFAPAAAKLRVSGRAPLDFDETHRRFLELLEDEKLLSALYPKAKARGDIDLKDLEALQSLF
ncbi:hypothetical protein [Desulfurivibrio dismutans]|uniref:hypothetical protein n=1 Tax=Desulfurivibrio dismutans TaxID=1398908 RepID=UPI0023D99B89|nr:hypothetical protein [Desulfurivibrio alkaliphilus]MDF1613598.1 hypothetical protein [Desulfurivibrio alkaliphilus]